MDITILDLVLTRVPALGETIPWKSLDAQDRPDSASLEEVKISLGRRFGTAENPRRDFSEPLNFSVGDAYGEDACDQDVSQYPRVERHSLKTGRRRSAVLASRDQQHDPAN